MRYGLPSVQAPGTFLLERVDPIPLISYVYGFDISFYLGYSDHTADYDFAPPADVRSDWTMDGTMDVTSASFGLLGVVHYGHPYYGGTSPDWAYALDPGPDGGHGRTKVIPRWTTIDREPHSDGEPYLTLEDFAAPGELVLPVFLPSETSYSDTLTLDFHFEASGPELHDLPFAYQGGQEIVVPTYASPIGYGDDWETEAHYFWPQWGAGPDTVLSSVPVPNWVTETTSVDRYTLDGSVEIFVDLVPGP